MSRSGAGWVDVTDKGQTVGFVVKPSRQGDNWHCYVDQPNGQSRHVGSARNQAEATEKVRRAAS